MEREYDKLQKQYARKMKLFKLWIRIAQKANQRAALVNMECNMITEQMTKVSDKMYKTSEEKTEDLAKEIESE